MNRIIAIFLSCAMLLHCLARFSVLGLYELRKDFVAKNLCENRSRPALNCCGKCVLTKQLAKADERDGDSEHAPKKTSRSEHFACLNIPDGPCDGALPASVARPYHPRLQRKLHSEIPRGVFRPPAT